MFRAFECSEYSVLCHAKVWLVLGVDYVAAVQKCATVSNPYLPAMCTPLLNEPDVTLTD